MRSANHRVPWSATNFINRHHFDASMGTEPSLQLFRNHQWIISFWNKPFQLLIRVSKSQLKLVLVVRSKLQIANEHNTAFWVPKDSELKNSANLKCIISHVQLLAANGPHITSSASFPVSSPIMMDFFETRRWSFFVTTILAGCCSMMMQYVHPIPEKAEGEPSGHNSFHLSIEIFTTLRTIFLEGDSKATNRSLPDGGGLVASLLLTIFFAGTTTFGSINGRLTPLSSPTTVASAEHSVIGETAVLASMAADEIFGGMVWAQNTVLQWLKKNDRYLCKCQLCCCDELAEHSAEIGQRLVTAVGQRPHLKATCQLCGRLINSRTWYGPYGPNQLMNNVMAWLLLTITEKQY